MEIRSLYKILLGRFRETGRKVQPRQEEKSAAPRIRAGDRRELSSLTAALQEAERLEDRSTPVDTARLKKLEKEIDSGTYRVDLGKLAEAMMRSPEELSARGEKMGK